MRPVLLLAVLAACAPPPLTDFPEPATLAESEQLPDLFLSATSADRATTQAAWESWRRPQLAALFSHYQYGFAPKAVEVGATDYLSVPDVVPGATWHQWRIDFAGAQKPVIVALIHPNNVAVAPVILALNKCGNQSLGVISTVIATSSYVIPACQGSNQAPQWPLARIIERGYAVATFHESDAAPDDAAHWDENLYREFRVDERPRWATLAMWAWSLAQVASWLNTRADIDHDRIYVFGHSRRGKAALLAGMYSQEIDGVIAHQSGTGGSALHRSLEGETIELINSAFPHWFSSTFKDFAGAELKTPVDQHQLLALWAPRRVVLVDGDDDAWADPQGSRLAAEAAAPAWSLYKNPRTVSWQTRPGGHSVESSDWDIFLDALEQ